MSKDIQDLVGMLSSLHVNLSNIADTLRKLEQNEIESIKATYGIKGDFAGEFSDIVNKLENIEKCTDGISEKLLEKLTELRESLSQIQRGVVTSVENKLKNLDLNKAGTGNKVEIKEKDMLITRQDKWIKYLCWLCLFLLMSLLALLGLNLTNVVKLPNLPM